MSYKTVILLVSLIILGCSNTNQTAKYLSDDTSAEFLYKLVAQHPTEDTLKAILVNETILRRGSEAIVQIGRMLASEEEQNKVSAQNALMSLNFYVMRTGMQEQRKKYLSGIYKILQSNLNNPQKTRVINLLNFSGDKSSIPHLSVFLNDPALCHPACQALVAINTSQSGEAMEQRISQVSDQNRITLIKSLGDLGYTPAATEIMTYADKTKKELHLVTVYALAKMGYPAASSLFDIDYSEYNSEDLAYLTSLYLLWIENIKDNDQAASHLRAIINDDSGKYKSNIKINALAELLNRLNRKAMADLSTFIKSGDQKSRIAALEMATKTDDKFIISGLVDLLKDVEPTIQSDIIYTFGRRHYTSTYSVILDHLKSDSQQVRITSVNALAGYDPDKQTVDLLLSNLSKMEDKKELIAYKSALHQIPGDLYISDMASGMENYSTNAKVCALGILRERQAKSASSAILKALNDDSLSVRIAAIKALETLAGPAEYDHILSHFLKCEDKSEKKAAGDALIAVATQIKNREKQLEPIISAYQSANSEQKTQILPLLVRIGGKQSLKFVLSETKSNDPDIKEAAIRTLARWSGYEALEPLVDFSEQATNTTHQVLAIRGALQILGKHDLGSNYEVNICKRLLSAADRQEEKVSIIATMSSIRSEEALAGVSDFIMDPNLGDDAARAAIVISAPMPDKNNLKSDMIARTIITTLRGEKREERREDSLYVPEGYTALFNGRDLTGWKGLVANPIKRAKMSAEELAELQIEADQVMRDHWRVIDGILCFDGKGQSLCTLKDFGNFELLVDWKIEKDGDSGIYLRGSPQVQIWDPATNPVGSGGLYNNQKNPSKPLRAADNPVGEWNRFRIIMTGPNVTVYLNGQLVVDNVVMENYWERNKPIYASDAIELQAHHSPLYFKNIFIKELPEDDGVFEGDLFNGSDLSGWELVGAKEGSWRAENGILLTEGEGGGWISTTREFSDFELELEFRVPPDGNSGVFIRTPREGNPAYMGMEIQVLDDYAEKYSKLHPWQYTGSIYAVQAPSKRMTKKADQWQKMKIICKGPQVNVILNGEEIIDANLIDHMEKTPSNPGLKRRKGFIGLQNHSSKIEYRNIKIKELNAF